jgi:kinesin family member 12
MRMLGEFEYEI